MKRAVSALSGALAIFVLAAFFGCQNSSDSSAALALAGGGSSSGGSSPSSGSPFLAAAGSKLDAMEGEWVFDRSRLDGTTVSQLSLTLEIAKKYSYKTGDSRYKPDSLTISGRRANFKTLRLDSNDGVEDACHSAFDSFSWLGEYESNEGRVRNAKSDLGLDLEPNDVVMRDKSLNYTSFVLKLVGSELYVVESQYKNCCGYIVFRKKGSQSSGGGGGSSGSASFTLQGKWKMKGETVSGRWIQIKDGSFDFYKAGSLYNLYTDRTFAQSGSTVTVGYAASGMTVSDKFTVSGSASEMKWTLSESSYTSGGNAFTDTNISMALQSFWNVAANEIALVPYD